MPFDEQEKMIARVREYFSSKFLPSENQENVNKDVRAILANPLLKDHAIFSNSFVTVMDNSSHRYLWIADNYRTVFSWFDREDALNVGVDYMLRCALAEDMETLLVAMGQALVHLQQLPAEDKLHFRLEYDYRIIHEEKIQRLHQQVVPLTFNTEGLPHLVLAIVSDVTDLVRTNATHYKGSLNLPGQPSRLLFSGTSSEISSPLTNREKEIVQLLTDGKDSEEIARAFHQSWDGKDTPKKHFGENRCEKCGTPCNAGRCQ